MRRASAKAARASAVRLSFASIQAGYDARSIEAAVTPRRGRRLRQRFLDPSGATERVGEDHAPESQPKILGARSHAELHASDAFVEAAKPDKGCPERHVRLRVARVELERAPQQLHAALMLADVGESAAGKSEDVRGVWVDRDGALGFFARLRFSGRAMSGTSDKVGAESAEQRQQRARQREVRSRWRSPHATGAWPRRPSPRSSRARQWRRRLPKMRPGVDAVDSSPADDRKIGLGQCRFQFDHDAARDLVLKVKRVATLDVVAAGPQLVAVFGFDELHGDAHALRRAAGAAGDHVANS